jgi:hypothetical protein
MISGLVDNDNTAEESAVHPRDNLNGHPPSCKHRELSQMGESYFVANEQIDLRVSGEHLNLLAIRSRNDDIV